MKCLTIFAALLIMAGVLDVCFATTEPVCGYRSSDGEMKFLKYFSHAERGEEYVDFGTDGKCVKKATCQDDYTLKIDDCSNVRITCDNRNQYGDTVFPRCCVKC